MWMAERGRATQRGSGDCIADVGVVTLSQELLGVYLDGERRQLSMYGPAGYSWRPKVGDKVLALKMGEDASLGCVLAAPQETRKLQSGEVCIFSQGGAEVHLSSDGEILMSGNIKINGQSLEDMIRAIVAQCIKPE